VVDDEPLARDLLIRLLARLNVQVCGEASDGQQALAQARSLTPDVVLLDIQIPGLSGLQVAQALGDVPFVFTTRTPTTRRGVRGRGLRLSAQADRPCSARDLARPRTASPLAPRADA